MTHQLSNDYINHRITENSNDITGIKKNFVRKIEFKPYKDLIRFIIGVVASIVVTAILGLIVKNTL